MYYKTLKALLRENNGQNFIIKTSELYYDEVDKVNKFYEYYGQKIYTKGSDNTQIDYIQKTDIMEITEEYIKLKYSTNPDPKEKDKISTYIKYIELQNITSLTFAPNNVAENKQWKEVSGLKIPNFIDNHNYRVIN